MKDSTVGLKLLYTTGQKWRCQHLCSLQYYKDNLRIVFHIFTEKHRPGGIVQSVACLIQELEVQGLISNPATYFCVSFF